MIARLAAAVLAASPALAVTPAQNGGVDLYGEITWRDTTTFTHGYMRPGLPVSVQVRLDLSAPPNQLAGGALGYVPRTDFSRVQLGGSQILHWAPTVLTDLIVTDGTAGAPDTIALEHASHVWGFQGGSHGTIEGRVVLVIRDIEGDAWSSPHLSDLPTTLDIDASPGTTAELTFFDLTNTAILTASLHSMDVDSSGESGCPGFPNSAGLAGRVTATGSRAVADNSLVLVADRLPPDVFGFFIMGAAEYILIPDGGSLGILCITGPLGRFISPGQVQNSGASGVITLPVDLHSVPIPTGLDTILAGDTRYIQLWHRDTRHGGLTSLFTGSLAVTFE